MSESQVKFDEQKCLQYNPFEGDFGEPGDRVLKDKICTSRKTGECHNCGTCIQPGERTRRLTAVFGGQLLSYRWCELCCSAMAAWWTDDGEAMTARFASRGAAHE